MFSAPNRKLLDDDDKTINEVFEECKEDLTDLIDSIFGEECLSDSGCAPLVAFCDRSQGFSGSLGLWILFVQEQLEYYNFSRD